MRGFQLYHWSDHVGYRSNMLHIDVWFPKVLIHVWYIFGKTRILVILGYKYVITALFFPNEYITKNVISVTVFCVINSTINIPAPLGFTVFCMIKKWYFVVFCIFLIWQLSLFHSKIIFSWNFIFTSNQINVFFVEHKNRMQLLFFPRFDLNRIL